MLKYCCHVIIIGMLRYKKLYAMSWRIMSRYVICHDIYYNWSQNTFYALMLHYQIMTTIH